MNSLWQNANFKSLQKKPNFQSANNLHRNSLQYQLTNQNDRNIGASNLNPFALKIDTQTQLNQSFGNIQQSYIKRNDSSTRISIDRTKNLQSNTSIKRIRNSQSVDKISQKQSNFLTFSNYQPFQNKNLQQIFTPKKVNLPPPRKNIGLPIKQKQFQNNTIQYNSNKNQNVAKNYQSLKTNQKDYNSLNLRSMVQQRLSTTYQKRQPEQNQIKRGSISVGRQRKSVPLYYSKRNEKILKVELIADRNYQLFRKTFNPEQYNDYKFMQKIVDLNDNLKPSIYHQVEKFKFEQKIEEKNQQEKQLTRKTSLSQTKNRFKKHTKNPLEFNLHKYHKQKKQSLNYISL